MPDSDADLVPSAGAETALSGHVIALPCDPLEYLADFQRALALSACPAGTAIVDVRFVPQFTPKGPALVRVAHPDGSEQTLVVKMSRSAAGILTEALLFPVLSRLGLPVPLVLAGPSFDPDNPQTGPAIVMSYLPGIDLQRLSQDTAQGVHTAGKLVMDGIRRLHSLTEAVRHEEIGRQLPQITLLTELQMIVERGGPWLQVPLFRQAVQHLIPALAAIRTPLVFSNGDYQPANFLTDGQGVVGFVDFELARFEDPHYGVAKYRVYDMAPLHTAGFVERYLAACGLSEADFAPRLAVRCLWTLQREISISDLHADDGYGYRVIHLLRQALRFLQ